MFQARPRGNAAALALLDICAWVYALMTTLRAVT
jgi:hypothetical protein